MDYVRCQGNLDLRFGNPAATTSDKAQLVILVHVVEHVLDFNKLFRDLTNLLAPEGLIYVEVPSVFAIWRDYGLDSLQYFQNAHIHHFTRQNLLKLFVQNGYEHVSSDFRSRVVFRKAEKSFQIPRVSSRRAIRIIAWFKLLELLGPFANTVFRLAQGAILRFRAR